MPKRTERAADSPVLVTGGAGYIGAHVVRHLLARGARVRVLDSFVYGRGGLTALEGNLMLEVVHGDIRDARAMYQAVQGVRAVVALAALAGDQLCKADPKEAYCVNFEATGILAETARASGVHRVIYASSCNVYGCSGSLPVDESTVPKPVSIYAQTCRLSEELLLTYPSIGPIVLRLPSGFGVSPRMRFDLLLNAMTAQAVTEGKISVSHGYQWQPFVHVQDAARAFVSAVEAPGNLVHGQRFNVGASFLNSTIADLALLVARCVPRSLITTSRQEGATWSCRAKFDRVRDVLSFEPHWTLGEGIGEVADALNNGANGDYRHGAYESASQ
jgi:nucleoside-diphosphate-sugar epimerase